MEFFRRTFHDIKLRLHVSKVCSEASKAPAVPPTECMELAEAHPHLVASVIGDGLGRTSGAHLYGYLVLLEGLVNSCSSSFHSAMAQDCVLQENLVSLAIGRAEGSERRRSRHLARLTLLEYSRMFADEPELQSLAVLARKVEQRTGRHLLRAIVLENKSVRFVDPRPQDIVVYSPTESTVGTAASADGPAAWPCPICTSVNRSTDETCLACGAARYRNSNTFPLGNKSAVVNGQKEKHTCSDDGGEVNNSVACPSVSVEGGGVSHV
ncbi:Zn-finger in Ran binding protein and others, putative [Trypanosoma equiperdum]|uniref:RanBP2-type domain-containing protein n=3 Tax=Trypanozoon TaxID=39700 RepID=Q585P8_TRYB2|nr:hypothetical protein, conserved [Trypanosoma brucei brucei TREU927]AAX79720.1 hypothetical protein, conserved [Trypanosoma brucei]AAZ11725.1 hypothetical protein, conserved [Trypanosoma brucei brucei TREU927]RHW72255.1 Zn-finger in Ran binding protein [Trypanosoma brucei equiperdum]SCU73237.1 Zn-finger in Ran binding protein and others, putative [Trypanosoma equiperdum]